MDELLDDIEYRIGEVLEYRADGALDANFHDLALALYDIKEFVRQARLGAPIIGPRATQAQEDGETVAPDGYQYDGRP